MCLRLSIWVLETKAGIHFRCSMGQRYTDSGLVIIFCFSTLTLEYCCTYIETFNHSRTQDHVSSHYAQVYWAMLLPLKKILFTLLLLSSRLMYELKIIAYKDTP